MGLERATQKKKGRRRGKMKKKKRWDVAAFTIAGGIFGTMIGWGIVYLIQR